MHQIRAWPGFKFSTEIKGIDEFGNPTSASARFLFTPFNESEVHVATESALVTLLTALNPSMH